MEGLPLSDARALRTLARRTAIQRSLLAAAVILALLFAVLIGREPAARTAAFLPEGSQGIVVLDLSASISADTHQRIRTTLLRLAATGGRYGLVLFSDSAYEALPPGTDSTELRRVARYYATREGMLSAPNPWSVAFSGGTRISTGLQLARSILERDRLARGSILLVSDLDDDPGDLPLLRRTLVELQAQGTVVRAVGLNAAPEDERLFRRLLAEPGAVGRAGLEAPTETAVAETALVPRALVAFVLVLAALLAANELWRARVRWAA
jgi:hypothetical protein